MAEAVAAFGLAANIIQFLDGGSKFVFKVHMYYRADRRTSADVLDIGQVTKDFKDIAQSLQTPDVSTNSSEHGLYKLAQHCQKTAEELLDLLNMAGKYDKSRKRDSLKNAFYMVYRESDVKDLESRLTTYRQELTLQLLVSLRQQAQKSLETQEAVLRRLSETHNGAVSLETSITQRTVESVGIGELLLDVLTAKLNKYDAADQKGQLRTCIIRKIQDQAAEGQQQSQQATTHSMPAIRKQVVQSAFLQWLQFTGMDDREAQIAKAHEATFLWLFEDDEVEGRRWSNFRRWLETDSPLYWITGKPGSGKSTLMKFICDNVWDSEASKPAMRCQKYHYTLK